MTKRKTAAITLAALGIAISNAINAQATTDTPPKVRFTQAERSYIKHFKCNEDEYLVVRSRYINPAVTYNTPARPLCIQIDDYNYRPATKIG